MTAKDVARHITRFSDSPLSPTIKKRPETPSGLGVSGLFK
jgi:hypothetical protein